MIQAARIKRNIQRFYKGLFDTGIRTDIVSFIEVFICFLHYGDVWDDVSRRAAAGEYDFIHHNKYMPFSPFFANRLVKHDNRRQKCPVFTPDNKKVVMIDDKTI